MRVSIDYPDIICRIPLFLPLHKREIKPQIYECDWGTVNFLDFPLTMVDEDLFMLLLNWGYLHSENQMGMTASLYKMVKEMGKTYSKTNCTQIMNSIEALSHSKVEFKTYNIHFIGTLINSVDTSSKKIEILLNPQLSALMHLPKAENGKYKGTIRHLNLSVRYQLSMTGRAMHRFMSGHGLSRKFRIEKIWKATAPHMRLNNFRIELRETLTKLIDIGFLVSGEVVKEYGEEFVKYKRLPAKSN